MFLVAEETTGKCSFVLSIKQDYLLQQLHISGVLGLDPAWLGNVNNS